MVFKVGYTPNDFTLSARFGGDFSTVSVLTPVVERFGVRDSLGLVSIDPSGKVVTVGSPLPRAMTLTPAFRGRCSRIAAHLTSAFRLRRKLAVRHASPLDSAAAVLTPSGVIEHARGFARSRQSRTALREAVIRQERARGPLSALDPDAALELWQGLVEGRWSLTDHFESDGRRYLVAIENAPEVAALRRLTLKERRVLAFAALGHPAKLIAYHLGLSIGTVSDCLVTARAKAGFRNRQQLARWFAAVVAEERARFGREGTEENVEVY
jgi:DNA-binding CsgD family transcriptional regulator